MRALEDVFLDLACLLTVLITRYVNGLLRELARDGTRRIVGLNGRLYLADLSDDEFLTVDCRLTRLRAVLTRLTTSRATRLKDVITKVDL